MTPKNLERASDAHIAMECHAELIGSDGPDVDPAAALRDMLTSLRHFSEQHQLHFGDALIMSQQHFEEEGGVAYKFSLRKRYGYGTSPSNDR